MHAPTLTPLSLAEQSRHYAVVSRAIAYLREHLQHQPSLQELAHAVGMSPHHLQRVFAHWAGISPKRFLQHLSKEALTQRLRAREDVLGAAAAVGLSGGGRAHDLLVHCEAVTPGEVQSGGRALRIVYGVACTPFGEAFAGLTTRGLCHLQFMAQPLPALLEGLRQLWPAATLQREDEAVADMMAKVFTRPDAPLERKPVHLLLRGTNFQMQVWQALLRTATGELLTYSQLAQRAGAPRAARAVGGAMAANPIAWLIPCHRVIREGGAIHHYRWGVERKMAMLAWEGAASMVSAEEPQGHRALKT